MSREILFRGKRKDNGEWVYGYYLPWHAVTDLQGNEPYAQIFEEHKVKGKYVTKGWAKVKFNTVGEYTGLTDKNGKKIFEGDIIKPYLIGGAYDRFLFSNGVVVFEYGAFRIKDSRQSTPLSSYAPRVAFEVIGNIYDNPELLEVEE